MKEKNIVAKKRKTSLMKYGNENYVNSEKTLNTIKYTNLKKISKKFNIDAMNYKNKQFTIISNTCDHIFQSYYDLISKRSKYNVEQCVVCNPIGVQFSNTEKQLLNFIKEKYSGDIIENSRKIISPYEIDIFLPNMNIAIEFYGLYWHSDTYRNKKYHKMKYNLCLNKEIQLLQIFDDDWFYRKEIVKSMILNKLKLTNNKIYGRKTEIREVTDNKIIKLFLINNHIQGWASSSIKIGLYFEDELVSLMTFKRNKNDYELNRFCNKLNHNIIGSASKLFKYFIKNYNYKSIISFSNNLYSNGNLYRVLNFRIEKQLNEDYSYIINNNRQHKFNFRKEEKTKKIKLDKIYDAGKIKFIYP